MKASFSWLRELVETDLAVEEIAESLSISGFEVEDIEDMSQAAKGVVVGFVEEVVQHPNADKLKVCKVNTGLEKPLQIVCGASNVRKGLHVLVATVGSNLKAIGLLIKKSELRGVVSEGMICSLEELGLQDETKGIALLEEMNIEIPELGSTVDKILGLNDILLDLAITANRPDGMSMVGLARELSAITSSKLTLPKIKNFICKDKFTLQKISETTVGENGIYSLHYIENIKGDKLAPKWIVERLERSGIKSINAIVDITNYVMLEQGQPLHAFDSKRLNKIVGKEIQANDFSVRKARENEMISCLDNNDYYLDNECHLVTCSDIPIAIAGIIGGSESSVTRETESIWLEAAVFTPKSVRISSRNIGVRTESSSRYEKGISPEITLKSVNRAIELYKEIFNCKVVGSWTDRENIEQSQIIDLRRDRVKKILGMIIIAKNDTTTLVTNSKHPTDKNEERRNLLDKEIINSLQLLGCELSTTDYGWAVKVPDIRKTDLTREIDLIEEIARIIGYDKFDSKLPYPIKPGGLTPKQLIDRKIRNILTNTGFQEVTAFSLVPSKKNNVEMVGITNPLLADTSHLRINLWEEHLNICSRNVDAGQDACWLYEIGKVYKSQEGAITEKSQLCGAISGTGLREKWSTDGKAKDIEYFDARGKLENLFEGLNLNVIDKPLVTDKERMHPGRSTELYLEGKRIGIFGQIHPELANARNLKKLTYIFELDLDNILIAATRESRLKTRFKEFPTVPSMERDIAVVVAEDCLCSDLISTISKAGTSLLESVILIDKYAGENIGSNEMSLTFRLTFRKKDETLKESEINPSIDKIKTSLAKKHHAHFRE